MLGGSGQRWTMPDVLRAEHRIISEVEDGITTLSIEPGFAIGQRAFLVPDGRKNLMWECLSLVTDDALDLIEERGGVSAIAISHPHFYGAMVEWSDALGGVPIHLHTADRKWVQRPSPAIRFWDGDHLDLSDQLSLVHLGAHFAGSTGLLWRNGPRLGGSLLPGDAVQVAMDRRSAGFMYSYPNAIPLARSELAALEARIAPLEFDDVFGFARGRQIIGGGKQAVDGVVRALPRRHCRLNPRRPAMTLSANPVHTETIPWVPLRDGVSMRPLHFEADGYALQLKVEPGTTITRHRHTGPVHALNLSGYREIIDTAEIVGPGEFVFEPAGNVDSWRCHGEEACVVQLSLRGRVEYLDECGHVTSYSDSSTALSAYRDHCRVHGLVGDTRILGEFSSST